jgi:GDSL/SGNH-like Acyl-Esterase family found in Pmr5 and Cas1p
MRHIEGFRIPIFLGVVFTLLSVNTFNNVWLLDDVFLSKEKPMDTPPVQTEQGSALSDIRPQNVSASSLVPLCRREQLGNGQWVPVTLDAPPYISKTMHLRCPIAGYDYENPDPWKSWDWVPADESCQFSAWNSTEFCDLLPFATVSIIGDSLSWEHYSSLVQLLGGRVRQTHQHVSRLEQRNHVQAACRGRQRGTKVVWRNDARLNAAFLLDSITNDFPMVLILNRGAHYVNDTVLTTETDLLLPVLSEWQATCARLELKCHLFWRTTVPGHPHCANFAAPVNDLSIMESHIQSPANYNETTWNYHWQDFQHQNKLILQKLRDYSHVHGLQYEVIDAYELNVLRPDGHRWHQEDCLHNCYPGKMDVYNQLLLHFLRMQRSPADAQHHIQMFERYRARKAANQNTTPKAQ